MQVFYVNIGGGEPTVRTDFWELVEYATAHHVGVKFSTNGVADHAGARRVAARQRLRRRADLARRRDRRGQRLRPRRRAPTTRRSRAMEHLRDAGFAASRSRVVVTRENVGQLDDVQGDRRPLRRAAAAHPAAARRAAAPTSGTSCTRPPAQQRALYDWLLAHGEDVLTGDSFFHLAAYGEPLPGLNLCGAGRVVCLIDPVGDVYACPFAIHDDVPRRQRARRRRLRRASGATSELFQRAARAADRRRVRDRAACTTPAAAAAWRRSSSPACRSTAPTPSACSATARRLLAARGDAARPAPAVDHSRRAPAPTGCDESPLAGCVERPLRRSRRWLTSWFEIGRRGAAAGASSGCRRRSTRRSSPAPSAA